MKVKREPSKRGDIEMISIEQLKLSPEYQAKLDEKIHELCTYSRETVDGKYSEYSMPLGGVVGRVVVPYVSINQVFTFEIVLDDMK